MINLKLISTGGDMHTGGLSDKPTIIGVNYKYKRGQPLVAHFLLARGVYLVQVALAAIAAPFMDTIGDRLDG